MSDSSTTRSLLEGYPIDQLLVSLVAIVAAYSIITDLAAFPRLVLALALVFFLPGYAATALLFPTGPNQPRPASLTGFSARPGGIDTPERLGLALALSIVISTVVVLVLPLTGAGFDTTTGALALAGTTILFSQAGALRRMLQPRTERYEPPPVRSLLGEPFTASTRISLSAFVLAVAIVIAVTVVGFALLDERAEGSYTEVALYGEDEDGELVLGEFPAAPDAGDSIPYVVTIENHEHQSMEYTVYVQEQTVSNGTVTDRSTHQTTQVSIQHGDIETIEDAVEPTAGEGETVRIAVLVFEGTHVGTPTIQEADEHVYFWVTPS